MSIEDITRKLLEDPLHKKWLEIQVHYAIYQPSFDPFNPTDNKKYDKWQSELEKLLKEYKELIKEET